MLTDGSQLSILSEKDENSFVDVDDEDAGMAPVLMSAHSNHEDDADIEIC